MNTTSRPALRNTIVVGVDGSTLSHDALAWAAAEAERRGLGVHILHVFVYIQPVAGYAVFDPADPEELGGHVCEEAAATIRSTHPDLPVTTEVRVGRPAPELVQLADESAMVVLGARGHGRIGGLLIGSVSQQVATHARCPVVVVRGTERADRAPVVVGMDGSSESVEALRFALDHARSLGAPVRVVHSEWVDTPPGAPLGAWYGDLIQRARERTEAVRSAVDDVVTHIPGVDVEFRAVDTHPVDALTEESEDASLLVVASRGLGGFAGLLLGSVSQGVLSRATVPVAIVPRHRHRGDQRSADT